MGSQHAGPGGGEVKAKTVYGNSVSELSKRINEVTEKTVEVVRINIENLGRSSWDKERESEEFLAIIYYK